MKTLRAVAVCAIAAVALSCGAEPRLDPSVAEQALVGNLSPLKMLVSGDSSTVFLRDHRSKRTALHYAAYWGDSVFTLELLRAGADVDPADAHGNSPLYYAADGGHAGALDVLLSHGASVNWRDRKGDTPLHRAVFWRHTDTIRLLLERDADPDIHGFLGWTPLHIACAEYRDPDDALLIARLLVEYGASVNPAEDEGFHPIHYAAIAGHRLLCEFLLDHGEAVDPNGDCHSPLNQAARSGALDTVKLLVERGHDVTRLDHDGDSSLHLAITAHRTAMGRGTDSPIASGDSLPESFSPDIQLQLIDYLIDHGARVDRPDHEGEPPLHRAVKDSQVDVLRLLIARGADVNQPDGSGWPPLHWAASRDNLEVIDILIGAGADVNAVDLSGQTAIKHAFGNERVKSLLRVHGAVE